jgi:hypothetical protein
VCDAGVVDLARGVEVEGDTAIRLVEYRGVEKLPPHEERDDADQEGDPEETDDQLRSYRVENRTPRHFPHPSVILSGI